MAITEHGQLFPITTSSVAVPHAMVVVVQRSVLFAERPVTVVVGLFGFAKVAVPLTTDHVPVPDAAKVAVPQTF
jgi:hypothetical protein